MSLGQLSDASTFQFILFSVGLVSVFLLLTHHCRKCQILFPSVSPLSHSVTTSVFTPGSTNPSHLIPSGLASWARYWTGPSVLNLFFCFWFFFLYFFLLQVNSAPVLFHHKLGPICSSPTDRFPREGISLWQLCNASIHVTTSKQTCLKWQCLTTLWFIVDTICIEHQTSVSSVNTNGHRTMFRYCHF